MNILYICKWDSGDNQDEQAIAYALTRLGHKVTPVHENHARYWLSSPGITNGYDWLLFHKWGDVDTLSRLTIPKFFWYFDLVNVESYLPTSATAEPHRRIEWMRRVAPQCTAGFVTDGTWADEWEWWSKVKWTGKYPPLNWLPQGADERVIGKGHPLKDTSYDILLTGLVRRGTKRAKLIDQLRERYPEQFHVIGANGHKDRVHGLALADVIASTKVMIAPDDPVSDRYWSNRVFLTLGFGGYLLHPYCEGLTKFYDPTILAYYHNRPHLFRLIDDALGNPEMRRRVSDAGLKATIERNLYRHRCEELCKIVEGYL